jgi:hypothetical protein
VTDDGYVVYSTSNAVKAVPIAGGTPIVLLQTSGDATVMHNVVFLWSSFLDAGLGNDATLMIWTSRLGAPQVVGATAVWSVAAASSDSSWIVYATSPSLEHSTVSLYAASVSAPGDASLSAFGAGSPLGSRTLLADKLDAIDYSCLPIVAFSSTSATGVAGQVGNEHAVVLSCNVQGAFESVTSYAPESWKETPLTGAALGFSSENVGVRAALSVDATGLYAAVATQGGQLLVARLDGSEAVAIDIPGTVSAAHNGTNIYPAFFGGTSFGNLECSGLCGQTTVYLSRSDDFVLYSTASGALRTSTVTVSTPRTLVGSGVGAIDAVSPDETWALFDSGQDPTTDLSLTPISSGGAGSLLVSGTNVGIFGDPFTADSRFAVFLTNVVNDAANASIGSLQAVAMDDPGTLIPLAGVAASSAFLSATDIQMGGSKVSFVDAYNGSVGAQGAVDIHVIDLSVTHASTVIARSVDPIYAVSHDQANVVFTVSQGGVRDGIYTVSVP